MLVTENYFSTLDGLKDQRLSYVAVNLEGFPTILATARTPITEIEENEVKAARIVREHLIRDIMHQLQEKLFGA